MPSIRVLGRHIFIRLIGVFSLAVIPAFTSPGQVLGMASKSASSTSDGLNLRQIGQSSLIYAQDHQDQLPRASDVWDYAGMLAENAGLNGASSWQSRFDPATTTHNDFPALILSPAAGGKPRELNPAFRKLRPCFAVALGSLNVNMPATTPIVWTRGLQSDGTWAKHSPYGEEGGYIYFIGGKVSFYPNLTTNGGELTRFDGTGKTSNILEALPPGTRIGEYLPTPEEQVEWANMKRPSPQRHSDPPWIFALVAIWTPFLAVSVYRFSKGAPGGLTVLLWPIVLTAFVLILIIPTV